MPHTTHEKINLLNQARDILSDLHYNTVDICIDLDDIDDLLDSLCGDK